MSIKNTFDLSTSYIDDYIGESNRAKFIAGAELEVENIIHWDESVLGDHGVMVETDGSLRGNAKEFLLPPNLKQNLVGVFAATHSALTLGPEAFSQRTSTHVHVNCMFSTTEQVKNTLLLYIIFEPLAFSFVGSDRKNNIHCVPLNYTSLVDKYKNNLSHLVCEWSKYTALNLMPLRELGTIEFRHLYGTNDTQVFKTWLQFIATLWETGHSMPTFSVEHLTNLTFLKGVCSQLLTPEYYMFCKERPNFVLEDNLLDVKLSFI